MNVIEHLNSDDLSSALSAAKQIIRSEPADNEARGLLAQLFCFECDWERADKQFETLGQQNTELLVGTGLLRQLVRGEVARKQFYQEGRMPELAGDPDDNVSAVLDALICIREGKFADATSKLKPVHAHTENLRGHVNGTEFTGGRDLDDIVSGYFEVLTTNGKFYWLPMEKVLNITFRGYERLQDRIWRSASIRVEGFNTEGEVYFPVCYCCDPDVWSDRADDQIKLGRKTDWYAATTDGPVRGMGQKLFMFGDREYSILELESFQGPLEE